MNKHTENQSPTPDCGSLSVTDGYALSLDPRPWWKRTAAKMWPWRHLDVPDLPEWAKDAVFVETRVELSFADRLRVLVSGRIRVRSQTLTENAPARCETTSIAHPLPPSWVDA